MKSLEYCFLNHEDTETRSYTGILRDPLCLCVSMVQNSVSRHSIRYQNITYVKRNQDTVC